MSSMETHITVLEKVRLKKPILVEGLPGIGNVGRIAAGYIAGELKMKKFAELYSKHFLPLVVIHENSVAQLLKCEFYYHRSRYGDLIVLTGDTQSITPEGHYEICSSIVDFAKSLGTKTIITLGGFAEGREVENPRVIGAATDKDTAKKYEKYGIDFGMEHKIGTIVGASGLLLGIGKKQGINGICIMGETMGMPLVTDPKAADAVLHTLVKILGIKMDLSKLEKTIKEMEKKLIEADMMHKKILREIPKKSDQLKYIG